MLGLETLPLDLPDDPLPEDVARIVADARALSAAMAAETGPGRIGGLVTTDAALAWRFLGAMGPRLPKGARFVEWGSGLGVVTTLAARRGWRATGLEIEPRLVGIARDFARRHAVDASFHVASYKPEGWDDAAGRPVDADTGHGFGLFDFDAIFGYPWPAERDAMTLFVARHARPGTLFLRHCGGLWCDAFRVLPA